jgi:hypothetical protein
MSIIEYLLACYGITLIVTESKIFKPFREFLKKRNDFIYSLFSCMMCLGFWVGTVVFLLDNLIPFKFITHELIFYSILHGAMVSGVNWFLYLILLNLEERVKDRL